MKIYLASSWKNAGLVFDIAMIIRDWGHEVDAFVDASQGRYVFNWREIVTNKNKLDVKSFLQNPKAKRAFREDKKWLDWAECCILLLPAGKSSHLEGGYAKGKGKYLIIFAFDRFEVGEFDVMYGFADLLTDNINEIKAFLREKEKV